MPSGNLSILTLTVLATAAVATNRFVTPMGAYPTAAAKGLGVARTGGAVGELLAVDILGTSIAEAGGAFAKDAALELDATGRVVVKAAGVAVARALEASTAAGAFVEVLLTPAA